MGQKELKSDSVVPFYGFRGNAVLKDLIQKSWYWTYLLSSITAAQKLTER